MEQPTRCLGVTLCRCAERVVGFSRHSNPPPPLLPCQEKPQVIYSGEGHPKTVLVNVAPPGGFVGEGQGLVFSCRAVLLFEMVRTSFLSEYLPLLPPRCAGLSCNVLSVRALHTARPRSKACRPVVIASRAPPVQT